MARPRKVIDASLVEKLAAIHCTNDEIAVACDCSPDTLERRFAGAIKRGRDKGKTSLRRYQWEAAQKGNISMLIWLGKQCLGQRDSFETKTIEAKVVGSADIVIRWTDDDVGADAAADAAAKEV